LVIKMEQTHEQLNVQPQWKLCDQLELTLTLVEAHSDQEVDAHLPDPEHVQQAGGHSEVPPQLVVDDLQQKAEVDDVHNNDVGPTKLQP
jgi:hypothetical protein